MPTSGPEYFPDWLSLIPGSRVIAARPVNRMLTPLSYNDRCSVRRGLQISDARLAVFLSHAHVDADVVEVLDARWVEEASLRVWLDK
jgi:hypothetical protein